MIVPSSENTVKIPSLPLSQMVYIFSFSTTIPAHVVSWLWAKGVRVRDEVSKKYKVESLETKYAFLKSGVIAN